MIELKNVTVDFENVRAVDNVSLKVDKGDIFGIVGFSGAGKSTLVRTINLLQRPSQGEVIIDGEDITKIDNKALRQERKKIGMIFQHFNLLKNLTIIDNVIYPIRKSDLTKEEKRDKALRLLKLVGIEEKADDYPRQLSGGQQQRVAIARALASDPQILLCDEATSALDPKTTKQILKILKEVNQKFGITIVIITHQMDVVKEICNKCVVMQDGVIVERGTTLEIFSNPQNPLTKEFVKTSTNIEQTVETVKANIGKLRKNEVLALLKYLGSSTTEPLTNEVFEKYQVETNVLAGNIEFISDVPVGNLVVTLYGERLDEAVAFFRERGAGVEILGDENGIF